MKKVLLSISFVLISIFAFSQASVSVGLKAGANFANTNIDGAESVTAFHGGAYGMFKFTKIGIQPEILFSKQGDDDVDLSYVNIPVMLKYYLAAGLNLQAGPQFGVLLNAEDGDGDDISEGLKNSDLSAAIGAGWDAPFGLNFTARYVIGLSDINDVSGGSDVKNRMFQLSVGYDLFKFGK